MRTPAGKECQYFYADYYRGRDKEECRLLSSALPTIVWKSDFCFTCPVPEILQANACPYLVLKPFLTRRFPFIKPQVKIEAYCTKTSRSVSEPHIGCGECHPLPFVLPGESGEPNSTA
jgi:hypothetical protein